MVKNKQKPDRQTTRPLKQTQTPVTKGRNMKSQKILLDKRPGKTKRQDIEGRENQWSQTISLIQNLFVVSCLLLIRTILYS